MSATSRPASPIVLLPRRSFLVAVGLGSAGLALSVLPTEIAAAAAPTDAEFRPNVFVHIAATTGIVSIVCARSEMGQGVRSTLPPFIADELGADMAKVVIVQGDGDKSYGDQNTDGSRSIRMDFDKLRRVGAAARMMMTDVAAKRWGVDAKTCVARDHAITHPPTKRSLSFGELALDAAKLPIPNNDAIVLRPRSELKTLGKELPLLDGKDIVTGKAVYGADVKLPGGMLTAVVLRPPVVGGKLARHDATKTLALPGVKKVVQLPSPVRPFKFQPLGGLAVVADDTWTAMKGRSLLEVTWNGGDNEKYDSPSYRTDVLEAAINTKGKVARNIGDVDAALVKAKRKVEAVYHAAHLAHATMEPPVAIAKVEGGACEIWTSTQNPQAAKQEVAKALGIDESKVTIHVTLLGGGFGRKSKPDYVVEAALVSRAVQAPVRLQWTREDDIQHDYYHSVSAQRLEAGLDANDALIAWYHRTAFPPIASIFNDATVSGAEGDLQQGVLDTPLAIPNVRAETGDAKAHARIGWLRSVANTYHAFAIQSFIDEIAHARNKDPKDNLLEVLGPPRIVKLADLGIDKLSNYGQPFATHPIDTGRHRRVVERVTELARWSDRKKDNRSLGLAVHRSFLTYVACIVSVIRPEPPSGPIRVDEAWIVADAGTIVNRERVRSQLEGAVIFGLSNAMYGAITMKNGATEQSNFRDFRLMRMAEAPRKVHVDIIESEGPSGGIGEPGVPPVAPALANAIFALTKTRVRELPMNKVVPL
jgi:isoquinoline 1-oxidoreductase subunit beta